jgi:hypothetical protein
VPPEMSQAHAAEKAALQNEHRRLQGVIGGNVKTRMAGGLEAVTRSASSRAFNAAFGGPKK